MSSYKYLGVSLDSQLNYNIHVDSMISSVSSKLKQFRRMRSFLNTKAAVLVYKSMLLPILKYGDIFLSATSLANHKKVQILQNKGLRCALNRGIETTTDELHKEAGLLKLHSRREQHLLNFMFDWSWDMVHTQAHAESAMTTRSHKKRLLKLKKPRTEKYKKSLSYHGPKKWNALPVEIHQTHNKKAFKVQLNSLIMHRAAKARNAQLGFSVKAPTPAPEPNPNCKNHPMTVSTCGTGHCPTH